jgi:hypothetical protein
VNQAATRRGRETRLARARARSSRRTPRPSWHRVSPRSRILEALARRRRRRQIAKKLSTAEIEAAYDLIAEGIDRAGEGKAQLFLAKLALVLANLTGDLAAVRLAVDAALKDL